LFSIKLIVVVVIVPLVDFLMLVIIYFL
jgi:hypothetical protein